MFLHGSASKWKVGRSGVARPQEAHSWVTMHCALQGHSQGHGATQPAPIPLAALLAQHHNIRPNPMSVATRPSGPPPAQEGAEAPPLRGWAAAAARLPSGKRFRLTCPAEDLAGAPAAAGSGTLGQAPSSGGRAALPALQARGQARPPGSGSSPAPAAAPAAWHHVALPSSTPPVPTLEQRTAEQRRGVGSSQPPAGPSRAAASLQPVQPDFYSQALQTARQYQQRHWQPSTNAQRERVWTEFSEWHLQHLPGDPAQCRPDDILVYLTSHWLQHHGRQVMEDGNTQPAPNTLASMLGHLSTRLQELGRRGTWDPTSGEGNPCQSMELTTFKGGYANSMQDAGYRPQAAGGLRGKRENGPPAASRSARQSRRDTGTAAAGLQVPCPQQAPTACPVLQCPCSTPSCWHWCRR